MTYCNIISTIYGYSHLVVFSRRNPQNSSYPHRFRLSGSLSFFYFIFFEKKFERTAGNGARRQLLNCLRCRYVTDIVVLAYLSRYDCDSRCMKVRGQLIAVTGSFENELIKWKTFLQLTIANII